MSTIPNTVMPHAVALKPVRRQRGRSVPARLLKVASFPALVSLGVGIMLAERLRDRLERGWLKSEG